MAATVLLMLALLLGALASGVAFSHLLEIPGKRRMPIEYAVAVQKLLYVGYRAPAAIIEVGAMLTAAVAMVLVWGEGAEFWLTLGALAALVGAMLVFVLVTDPQNRRILAWQADMLPADWTGVRARWEGSHGVRAALFLVAVGLLAAALHVAHGEQVGGPESVREPAVGRFDVGTSVPVIAPPHLVSAGAGQRCAVPPRPVQLVEPAGCHGHVRPPASPS